MQIIRDLYYLARETVGVITEGIELGLKVYRDRDESPGPDEITHGPAWGTDGHYIGTLTMTPPMVNGAYYFPMSSTDGAVIDPAVECSPAAAASATDAAAGHPKDDDLRRTLTAAAFGLKQWIDGESCGGPTYFGWIIRDLEDLSK